LPPSAKPKYNGIFYYPSCPVGVVWYVIPYVFVPCDITNLYALATVTFFSLIVLGTAAHILSVAQSFITAFDAFAVAVAVLTLVTLPVLYVLRQHLR
jgi:VIT1/CCC1 family predicted Fe2+/Mn2+ transporter